MTLATGQVLVTKLFVPAPRPSAVPRPRLVELLDSGLDRHLTIVCAPAGFGKSTLLSAWVTALARPVAWLSLDEADSDPVRFLTYLIAALRTVAPALAETSLLALQSPQPPPAEAVLIALLNEVSALPHPVVLVLDDYHSVDDSAVDAMLAFLLEHLPPQLRLVVSSRQDPDIPLARLRARGQLSEVRAADLRFTPVEAAAYLTSTMGLSLTPEDIAALERRTEGWIAGLQLVALSLRGHDDASAFISGFAGDHRYIADYLVGEVLDRQPDDVRGFLLQTSVLERMTGPLCDAVTGQEGGSARLEALDRGNYFLVPQDDRRRWYRYHHLFADVLRAYLLEERPDEVSTLHRRASDWYERQGSLVDAIRHALASEDVDRLADLLERAAPALQRARQEATLLTWLRAVPDHVLEARPVLSAEYAGVLLSCGQVSDVDARLSAAERWLAPGAPTVGRVVVDEGAYVRLPGSIAMWRAGGALMRGDEPGAVMHAERALALSADDDHLTRGGATALLGLASWWRGDLEAAFASYSTSVEHLRTEGNLADVVGCAVTLADLRVTQGRLTEAMAIYEEGLRLATAPGQPALRGAADMHVGLSGLRFERGELDAAREHLARADELGDSLGMPRNPYRSRVAKAQLRQAEGDLEAAAELLREAERVYDSDFSPKVRPVPAVAAHLLLARGDVEAALRWARDHELSAADDLTYVREFEHITLARVLLAQATRSALEEAMALLQRLLVAADAGGRAGNALEVLVLQALGLQARGETRAALVPLGRALALGSAEGYVRTFLNAGRGITELLHAAVQQGVSAGYARQLLAAGGGERPAQRGLIDPLSERELDVLRLLGTDLSGPDIARELVVSLHTVRSHTKSIYTKLDVNTRRAAVRQAEVLNLLPGHHP